MKKVMSLLVVLQIIFLAIGYGAGTYMEKSAQTENAEPDEGAADSDKKADGDAEEPDSKPIVVKLGQMIVPVYKPRSVTYVVINLALAVEDVKAAERYNEGDNGVQLRDVIFASLKKTADGREMRGPSIDTEKLAADLTKGIQEKFGGIKDVLFLDFYKKDVARS